MMFQAFHGMRITLGLALALCGHCFPTAAITIQDQQPADSVPFQKLQLNEPVADWIVDETTGRLFAALPQSRIVVELDASGKGVAEYDFANRPQRLLIKANKLVVAMGGNILDSKQRRDAESKCSVSCIDLQSGEIFESIELPGTCPADLFASEVDNGLVGGLVYAQQPTLFQLDLDQWQLKNSNEQIHRDLANASNLEMSPDGKWLMADQSGLRSSSGACLFAVNEQAFAFSQHSSIRGSFSRISAGPANRFWVLGDKLAPIAIEDEKSILKNFSWPVQRFNGRIHPKLDLVAFPMNLELSFCRLSDGVELKRLQFKLEAEDFSKRQRGNRTPSRQAKVFFGPDGQVFACYANVCQTSTLEQLGVEAEPHFLLQGIGTVVSSMGQPLRLEVGLLGRSSEGVDFALRDPVANVSLQGQEIHFVPNVDQLGPQTLTINASDGSRSDQMVLVVDVRPPQLEFDFNIAGFRSNREGTLAVCWGTPPVQGNDRSRFVQGEADTGPHRLAIVDLENQEVILQKQIENGIVDAIITDEYVVLAPRHENSIVRLDRSTLTNPAVKHFARPVSGLFSSADRELTAVIDEGRGATLEIFSVENLERIARIKNYEATQIPKPYTLERAEATHQLGGMIFDTKTGKCVCLRWNPGLPFVSGAINQQWANRSARFWSNRNQDVVWNRFVNKDGISDSSIKRIHTFDRMRGLTSVAIDRTRPLVYRVNQTRTSRNGQSFSESSLTVHRLIDGEKIDEIPLGSTNPSTASGSDSTRELLVESTSQRLIFAGGATMTVVPVTPPKGPLAAPLEIIGPGKLLIDGSQEQRIPIQVRGGSGKLQFALKLVYEGIEIDSESGEVLLDLSAYWPQFVKQELLERKKVQDYKGARAWMPQSGSSKLPPEEIYRMLFRREPPDDMVAGVVPIHVIVSDKDGNTDESSFFVVAAGSATAEKKQLMVAAAQRRRIATVNRFLDSIGNGLRRYSELAAQAAARERDQFLSTPSATIEQLEQRVEKMEQTASVILRLLDKLESQSKADRKQ